ncbi:MAG: hypothetical protein ABSH39_18440 [Candidatus Acidiferrum sp.]|jgi:hypothetical protein
MNCEQVEAIVLDMDRADGPEPLERAAALAHLSHCSRCAALQESWQAAREELRSLSGETLEARAPSRVEMRLRQEFRMRHRAVLVRRVGLVAVWALAAAAVLVGTVSLWNSRRARPADVAKQNEAQATLVADNTKLPGEEPGTSAAALSGDNSGEFTPVPGAVEDETEEASILRVRMQRGSLGALGLPVNEERAGEWIQVDLLVGNDGLPQAVRLAQEEN